MENNEIQKTRNALSSRLSGRGEYEGTSVFDVVLLVLAVLMLAYSFVQAFWLSPVNIDGSSMNYTMYDDDWLMMDKLAKPERGDVVIIKINAKKNYIKRIIGMPGDTLKIKSGRVYLRKAGEENFTLLDEPYVSSELRDSEDFRGGAEITLGENEIFFMGDNRSNSHDSRKQDADYELQGITLDDVIGVVPEWSIKNRESITSYYAFWENLKLKICDFWKNLKLKVRSFFGFR